MIIPELCIRSNQGGIDMSTLVAYFSAERGTTAKVAKDLAAQMQFPVITLRKEIVVTWHTAE